MSATLRLLLGRAGTGKTVHIVQALNARQQELMEAFFKRASQDHGNMKGRQRAYAATFLGMVNTYAALGLNGMAKLDASLTHAAVHQFMHGIFS